MSAAPPLHLLLKDGRRLQVVPMGRDHLDQVLAVERASFPTPWSRESFLHEMLGNPFARALVALAGESPPEVAGYLCCWLIYEEVRINNVAVAPAWRRRGVGGGLVRMAVELGREAGCQEATLEVRPSNVAARALYEKLGFVEAGRRPRYYSDSGEDAVVMCRPLRSG